ncbi:uncharacterized protein LOC127703938 [Mytilus californianus]|uniref:uncharacterized protein LOC127703938 n=1 Tax=Mytilus californianus TaxID=6549 RepID=UPI002246907C|nr:uncharacterized protein LOC127703938 [Mytilus californianus]
MELILYNSHLFLSFYIVFTATGLAECPGSCRAHDARLAEVMSSNQQDLLRYTASLYGTSSVDKL